MKVKNRAIGSVCELVAHGAGKYITEFAVESEDGSEIATYSTIDELQEYWETYEQKEPLIGDEDERELVSKWASIYCIKKVVARITEHMVIELADFDDKSRVLAIDVYTAITDGIYTITELCGEEEE